MNTKNVNDILIAIRNVKTRIRAAMTERDNILIAQLMGDLYGLECCLVGETEKLVAEIEAETEKEAA